MSAETLLPRSYSEVPRGCGFGDTLHSSSAIVHICVYQTLGENLLGPRACCEYSAVTNSLEPQANARGDTAIALILQVTLSRHTSEGSLHCLGTHRGSVTGGI